MRTEPISKPIADQEHEDCSFRQCVSASGIVKSTHDIKFDYANLYGSLAGLAYSSFAWPTATTKPRQSRAPTPDRRPILSEPLPSG
jgi:hypothetical protein